MALRFILETIAKACAETEEAPDAPDIFAHVDFSGFFNLDWCSKIRYHSVIFTNPLPLSDLPVHNSFIRNSTLLQDFVREAKNQNLKPNTIMIVSGKKVYEGAPKEGLPDDDSYESKCNDSDHSDRDHDTDCAGGPNGGASVRPHRFTPTNANAENMLQQMLKSVGKNAAARAYLGAHLLEMQSEIARIVQPTAKPQDLRRHFSKSDFANGRTRQPTRK
jgi:hypothetical protein